MAEIYANNARGRLAGPIIAGDETIELRPGHSFPDPGSNWYRATLYRWEHTPEGIREYDHEVVRVTALADDTLTVERALEGGPYAFDPDTPIELRMTAGTAAGIDARIEGAESRAKAFAEDYADPAGTAAAGMQAHESASDPHSQYVQKQSGHGLYPDTDRDKVAGLGSAASRDVGTSAGNVMEVGAFGIGTSTTPHTEPNAATIPGMYSYEGSAPDAPWSSGGTIVVSRHGTGFLTQIAISAGDGRCATRRFFNGSWSAWRYLYDNRNILGTVSQSGGVPAGAIIERGSNANGEYVKFADGTLICSRYRVEEEPGTSTQIVRHVHTADSNGGRWWMFPHGFVETPVCAGGAYPRFWRGDPDISGSNTADVGSGSICNTTPGGVNYAYHYRVWQGIVFSRFIAFGRWY